MNDSIIAARTFCTDSSAALARSCATALGAGTPRRAYASRSSARASRSRPARVVVAAVPAALAEPCCTCISAPVPALALPLSTADTLPASHLLAHSITRILGKLGGRNRRVLTLEPALKYRDPSEAAKVPISFAGSLEKIDIGPTALLACRTLEKGHPRDRLQAYNYLENCLSVLLNEGVVGRNVEATFVSSLQGIFDALYLTEPPELKDRAEEYL
ncbi:hypothetical protein K438DRAFT_1993131 [Mycena galopus ATCC 62051]|nr:hypothetical protein K438DRAFT_1993131 [Mycena galopus ATCC 62051]